MTEKGFYLPSASAPPVLALPTAIIGPQYCAQYPLQLTMVKKVFTISDEKFHVTDINGNIVFKVKGCLLTLHDRHVLLDAAGHPIITLRCKIATMHERWNAFRGESTNAKDLIFTLKRSSMIQFKIKLHVFLAGNTKEDVCDFTVKGSESTCIVYAGKSNNIVAKMDHLTVTVYPNVDYAFIVALIMIFKEIKADEKKAKYVADGILFVIEHF